MENATATMASAPSLPETPHAVPVPQILAQAGVAAAEGLSEEESRRRLEAFGANTITARRPVSALLLLAHQFASPIVYLLGGAALLAAYFGEWTEAAAIFVVLLLNALIGFFTEIKAARSIEALRALGTRSARMRRDGHVRLIPAEEMVPGDIVLVEAGDAVSADLRLIDGSNVAADESTLTGESVAVDKATAPVAAGARLGERTSMLFKGTALTRGAGLGLVVATGLHTELGRITQLVEEAKSETSPLERRLARLSKQLVWAVGGLTIVITGTGLATGKDVFLMVEAAIALAVAAIPEGLPIVATLTLARGMWRMASKNALIERLSAVETLGATTIILTDKTGTLTENRMSVRQLALASGVLEITPHGNGKDGQVDLQLKNGDIALSRLVEVATWCNDASLESLDADGTGDPMELALLRLGLGAGISQKAAPPRVRSCAFDAATKMMATVHEADDGILFAVKGAPESVLATATRLMSEDGEAALSEAARARWAEHVEELGRHGLRVIACAMKTAEDADADPYADLTFLGLIGLEDPARQDVPKAIADCHKAGIKVVMVTGDHAVTARSIGRQVGLADPGSAVAEGREVEHLVKDAKGNAHPALDDVTIFARVSPSEKLDLVRAYQAKGEVVAVTGDGVNDAPALKQADIGVAMGLRGTDVAREAAAMILLDDAFPSIVKAIREGRVIFSNIRRVVAYLIACNLSEVLVVGLAVLSTLPLPVLPLQILYLNLVTDVFPAFALAMGEGDDSVLRQPPRNPKEPILGRTQWSAIIAQSLALTSGTFGALFLATFALDLDAGAVVTVSFLTLAFAQLWQAFNMRSARSSLVHNDVVMNPWVWAALGLCTVLLAVPPYVPPLAEVLHLSPPTPAMWAVILGLSLAPLLVSQAVSLLLAARRRER